MKKFYCLYNDKNYPFSWKLKQAGMKSLANFKTLEDCLNYYLSLNNIGIIWFQKQNFEEPTSKNIKETFDGYIRSYMKNNNLVHVIEPANEISVKEAKEWKKNLYNSLQINQENGKDLLIDKNVDRLYNNKNSYLIFDNDVAEEVKTVYDYNGTTTINNNSFLNPAAETLREKIMNNDENFIIEDNNNNSNTNLEQFEQATNSKLSEVMQEIKNQKNSGLNEEQLAQILESKFQEMFNRINSLSKDSEINESRLKEIIDSKFNELSYKIDNQKNSNIDEFYITEKLKSDIQNIIDNKFNENFEINNNHLPEYYYINENDFDYQNDFENSFFKMQSPDEYNFNNNNNEYYDKILNNDFHKINRNYEYERNINMNNTNKNQLNYMNNQQEYPIQNPQYNGTIEFTALPNPGLNTNLNPLGSETMIFNPYSYSYSQPSNLLKETIIQPVIQPIIQTVYQPMPAVYQSNQNNKTILMDPIINNPISSSNYYSDYNTPTSNLMLPQSSNTNEYNFNNSFVQQPQQQPQVTKQSQPQQHSRIIQPNSRGHQTGTIQSQNNSNGVVRPGERRVPQQVAQDRKPINSKPAKTKKSKILPWIIVFSILLILGLLAFLLIFFLTNWII